MFQCTVTQLLPNCCGVKTYSYGIVPIVDDEAELKEKNQRKIKNKGIKKELRMSLY